MPKMSVESWLKQSLEQKRLETLVENELSEQSRLTLNEYYVLYFLNREPSKRMRLNDLQREIGLSQSALSRMIARMEDKNCGVIERRTCSADKRGIYIGITPLGEAKLASGQQVMDAFLNEQVK